MNATLLFGGGDALDAVDAAFVFQPGVDPVALNCGDNFFQSTERRRRAFEHFHFPALRFRVARIHAKKFAGEERGFITASPGANFQDDALFVVWIFGKQEQLQFALDDFLARRELFFLFVRELLHFCLIGFDGHLVRAGEIFFNLLVLAVLRDDPFELGVLLGDLLEACGIRDDFRRRKLLRQFVVARAELVQLLR